MPDDLRIPEPHEQGSVTSHYSTRRARSDPGMRYMTIAAALLGGGLVLGMGIWGMMGRTPGAVPVIEADSRPLRVKPNDPGGMTIAGLNDAMLGGKAAGKDRLAPTPEAPAPQALQAQLQPAAPSEPAAPAPVASATPAPAAREPEVSGSPLPDTPPPAPKPAKAAARPAPAEAPAQASEPVAEPPRTAPGTPRAATGDRGEGGAMVQLAAVKTEDSARSEWERLSKRMPELLGGRKPVFQRTEAKGRVYWRIRTGGFGSAADAAAFCGKVHAEKNNCAVASF